MNVKELKKALLQEAVQGKLVPQISSEGNAKDLLEEIRKEKAKLLKEGKLKKEKTLPEITEEDILFDIPENWRWCRLWDAIDERDGTHDTSAYIQKGYPLITSKDFTGDHFDFSKTKYISKKDYDLIIQRSKFEIVNILFSMIGGAQTFVSLNFIRNYPFPLSPLAEQKRIVAAIEKLLPLCEKLGN